jgi:hypothetical protein
MPSFRDSASAVAPSSEVSALSGLPVKSVTSTGSEPAPETKTSLCTESATMDVKPVSGSRVYPHRAPEERVYVLLRIPI